MLLKLSWKEIYKINDLGINEVVVSSDMYILVQWGTIGDSSHLGGTCSVPK